MTDPAMRTDEAKAERKYDLLERLISFALRVIGVVEQIPNTKAGSHVSGQLLRSGTSPAPNYAEAQGAESRKDFIHKLGVVLKELRETRVWLIITHRKPLVKNPARLLPLIRENDELISIVYKSVQTAKAKQRKTSRKGDGQ
ncbi:MAG: hypothetical protein BWX88_01736 [Planctomycetes bacterium ADurb.Bin126]|nr:MAG: hypothetical protein BWX88_01736 [Planctomycetes bacterium ADurb.Bin126]HOD82441.1 four helix bundle protein [Phycisphaerae bacterium]HQL74761.1 four helix bundle protein [Phycisphaerae bacterium]